ncbi:hypothetical protein MAALD49_20570 [Marinobacter shengliensis]|nr:hypothetical protein MAALD49_20570 [Marinobacter shengliensis]
MRTICHIKINRLVGKIEQSHHEFNAMTVTGFRVSIELYGSSVGWEVRIHSQIPSDET